MHTVCRSEFCKNSVRFDSHKSPTETLQLHPFNLISCSLFAACLHPPSINSPCTDGTQQSLMKSYCNFLRHAESKVVSPATIPRRRKQSHCIRFSAQSFFANARSLYEYQSDGACMPGSLAQMDLNFYARCISTA